MPVEYCKSEDAHASYSIRLRVRDRWLEYSRVLHALNLKSLDP